MTYQTTKLPTVPLWVKSGILYTPISTTWTDIGPFYNMGMEYNPDIVEFAAQNADFGSVAGEETFKITVEVAQWQSQQFFALWGGLAKVTVDGSGNITQVSFGGNTSELTPIKLLFVHNKAGGGGFYMYFTKVKLTGGGKFNIPEDKKIDKPMTMSVELTAVCDTTIVTAGEQLVIYKPFATGTVTLPTLS